MADIIIIVFLAAAVFLVLRGMFRKRGNGQCAGGCPGCGGTCGTCGIGSCTESAGKKED